MSARKTAVIAAILLSGVYLGNRALPGHPLDEPYTAGRVMCLNAMIANSGEAARLYVQKTHEDVQAGQYALDHAAAAMTATQALPEEGKLGVAAYAFDGVGQAGRVALVAGGLQKLPDTVAVGIVYDRVQHMSPETKQLAAKLLAPDLTKSMLEQFIDDVDKKFHESMTFIKQGAKDAKDTAIEIGNDIYTMIPHYYDRLVKGK
jgi:hypothetical protein